MRLIDADVLAEEIRKNMENGFPANEYLSLYAISCIAHAPTVCDIDAIKREIEDLYIITNPASDPYDGGYYTALIDVKRIIDKYTKGE